MPEESRDQFSPILARKSFSIKLIPIQKRFALLYVSNVNGKTIGRVECKAVHTLREDPSAAPGVNNAFCFE
jgi:hypothetical protein